MKLPADLEKATKYIIDNYQWTKKELLTILKFLMLLAQYTPKEDKPT